jgi:imidazolonepropionase-like amidohydrolase
VLPGGDVRDVYVVDGHITFAEPTGGAETILDGGWLTPGLVDAHAHLPLFSPAGDAASEEARVRASLQAQLDVGVLLVREPGSPTGNSKHLHDGALPDLFTAGRLIAAKGRYFPGLAREIDRDDLEQTVKEEAAASGAWVKLVADFWEDGGPVEPSWTAAQFRAAADTAHAAGARIAVHATCPESIGMAIDAGFDTIEHGHGMTFELVDAMAAAGITYVPTMTIEPPLRELFRANLRPEIAAHNLALLDQQPAMVDAAARAGVPLLAGTDAGMVPHGVIAEEIERMLAAGVAPDVAVAAGSWSAREYLGLAGIEEGGPADVVAFAADPRADAAELRRPVLVMLHGRVMMR